MMSKPEAMPAGAARDARHSLIPAEDAVCLQAFKDGARLQARKINEEKFDLAKKRVFLETLRRTANVTRSAKAAGIAPNTAYRHRARYPQFDLAWTEALVHALDVLETTMLERALRYNASLAEGVDPVDPGADPVKVEPFSNGDAMRLIKLHRESLAQRRIEIAARMRMQPAALRDSFAEELQAIHERLLARERAHDAAPA
jgi:hypothetical protein